MKQKKHLEIHVFSIFSRRKLLEYTTLHSWTTTDCFFHYLFAQNVLSWEKGTFFLCFFRRTVNQQKNLGCFRVLLAEVAMWYQSYSPPHEEENNFDTTMKTSASILRFSKLLSWNILFPFLPFSSISQYGIGLRCCCLHMKNIAFKTPLIFLVLL